MKKVLIILMLITSSTVLAQSSFGVKGGLNYGDNGEIEIDDITEGGDSESRVGYHFGVYYRAEFGGIYLRPELLYTETKTSFDFNNSSADYDVSKLDLPVLVGLKLVGPIHVFAGPSLQYILDNDLEGISIENVENDFTVGAQFGAGLQMGAVGLDFRYERGLTENEATVLDLDNPSGIRRIDTRPNQFILSLSIDF